MVKIPKIREQVGEIRDIEQWEKKEVHYMIIFFLSLFLFFGEMYFLLLIPHLCIWEKIAYLYHGNVVRNVHVYLGFYKLSVQCKCKEFYYL